MSQKKKKTDISEQMNISLACCSYCFEGQNRLRRLKHVAHRMFTQHNDSNRLIQTEIHITIHTLISATVLCKGVVIIHAATDNGLKLIKSSLTIYSLKMISFAGLNFLLNPS